MKDRKVENSRELLGLEPVSLMIKMSRLRWFGHVEKDDKMTMTGQMYDMGG